MSFATSRVFRGCSALLAKSAAATPATKPAAKAVPKAKPKAKPVKKVSGATGGGLMKPISVSPALRDFLGAPEISRAQALKKIWVHIKEQNLQNPQNKKEIICDDKLKTIFDGKDSVNFLEIGKLLSPHFVKTV